MRHLSFAALFALTVPVRSLADPPSRPLGTWSDDPVDYSVYDQARVAQPESVEFALTVVAVTNLYDAGNGERLWSIQSTCFEKSTMDEVLQEEARAIVRQLALDELVG